MCDHKTLEFSYKFFSDLVYDCAQCGQVFVTTDNKENDD